MLHIRAYVSGWVQGKLPGSTTSAVHFGHVGCSRDTENASGKDIPAGPLHRSSYTRSSSWRAGVSTLHSVHSFENKACITSTDLCHPFLWPLGENSLAFLYVLLRLMLEKRNKELLKSRKYNFLSPLYTLRAKSFNSIHPSICQYKNVLIQWIGSRVIWLWIGFTGLFAKKNKFIRVIVH